MEKSELLNLNVGESLHDILTADKTYMVTEQVTYSTYQLRNPKDPQDERYLNPENCYLYDK